MITPRERAEYSSLVQKILDLVMGLAPDPGTAMSACAATAATVVVRNFPRRQWEEASNAAAQQFRDTVSLHRSDQKLKTLTRDDEYRPPEGQAYCLSLELSSELANLVQIRTDNPSVRLTACGDLIARIVSTECPPTNWNAAVRVFLAQALEQLNNAKTADQDQIRKAH